MDLGCGHGEVLLAARSACLERLRRKGGTVDGPTSRNGMSISEKMTKSSR